MLYLTVFTLFYLLPYFMRIRLPIIEIIKIRYCHCWFLVQYVFKNLLISIFYFYITFKKTIKAVTL